MEITTSVNVVYIFTSLSLTLLPLFSLQNGGHNFKH